MKTLIAIFTFTKILIINEGNSFTFEKRKRIDSTGTVENVKILNDSVAVKRKGNNIYYFIK